MGFEFLDRSVRVYILTLKAQMEEMTFIHDSLLTTFKVSMSMRVSILISVVFKNPAVFGPFIASVSVGLSDSAAIVVKIAGF